MGVSDFLMGCGGLERAAERSEVKKCPGDTFLARGRVPGVPNASRRDVGGTPAYSTGHQKKADAKHRLFSMK